MTPEQFEADFMIWLVSFIISIIIGGITGLLVYVIKKDTAPIVGGIVASILFLILLAIQL